MIHESACLSKFFHVEDHYFLAGFGLRFAINANDHFE